MIDQDLQYNIQALLLSLLPSQSESSQDFTYIVEGADLSQSENPGALVRPQSKLLLQRIDQLTSPISSEKKSAAPKGILKRRLDHDCKKHVRWSEMIQVKPILREEWDSGEAPYPAPMSPATMPKSTDHNVNSL